MGSPAFEQARPDTADPARRLGPAAGNRDLMPGGSRLSAADQAFFGAAFGADFSRVRVHTDNQAAVSADAANADAFTFGHNVFFAEGRYAPATQAGRVLLGHELAHVVQQERGSESGAADDTSAQVDANQAGRAAAAGGPVAVTAARPVGLARQAAESPPEPAEAPADAGTRIEAAIVRRVLGALGLESTAGPVAVEFVRGMFEQLATEHIGSTLWAHLSMMSSGDAGQLAKGFGIGLGEGLFSPLTDLFGLAVFGERVSALEQTLLVSVLASKGDLSAAATWLAQEAAALRLDLHNALARLKSQSAAETVAKILELPDAMTGVAVQKAHELGMEAAKQIAAAMDSPWHPAQEQEASPSFTKTPLAWLQAKAGALESKIINTPWAEFGKKIGYGIGMVAIQIVLFVFTEGVGNAIEQVGAALGRVAGLLGRLGAGIGAAAARVAEFVSAVGKGVTIVEEGIGLILGKLLKPFEPLLQPIMRLLEDLRGFLRKLLGVPEKEIVTALEGTAAKTAGSLSHDVPPTAAVHTGPEPHPPVHTTPHPPAPTPKAPETPALVPHGPTAEPVTVPTASTSAGPAPTSPPSVPDDFEFTAEGPLLSNETITAPTPSPDALPVTAGPAETSVPEPTASSAPKPSSAAQPAAVTADPASGPVAAPGTASQAPLSPTPSGEWRPGDRPDLPTRTGNHPDWTTVRERVWRNEATKELAARAAGTAPRDRLISLNPIEELTDQELAQVAKTGVMPKRVNAEIEHSRIPRRMVKRFQRAGLNANEARELGKLGDPSNLEPTIKEWHAVVDESAVGRNPSLPHAIDDRKDFPLGSATNEELKAIVDTFKKRGLDLDAPNASSARQELRDIIHREMARRRGESVP